uniref:Uncharacterized protein n=1 Tax=Anguilla anguilla TaxID=7936 RepID=A0A0E9QX40_ANGAN
MEPASFSHAAILFAEISSFFSTWL